MNTMIFSKSFRVLNSKITSRRITLALFSYCHTSFSTITSQKPSSTRVANAALKLPPGAVDVQPLSAVQKPKGALKEECGTLPAVDDDLEDNVQMIDPNTKEWGGPTKGGTMPEPTRYGDWQGKGRCTDFS